MNPSPSPSASRVSGVLLAAGASRRFGGPWPKQLVLFRGEPLVSRAVRNALASRIHELIVVVGYAPTLVQETLAGRDLRTIRNPDYQSGQAGSVRTGLAAVDPAATGALILPCDQPLLEHSHLDALIAAHEEGRGALVVPCCDGERRGAPTLFDRALFGELATIRGDVGGRQIFDRHEESIVEVELDETALRDVDTREELQRLEEVAAADPESPSVE